jgi:hypothetical protein
VAAILYPGRLKRVDLELQARPGLSRLVCEVEHPGDGGAV